MVLALLGSHRFIHYLTSSKMLWWKTWVPNRNSKEIWLALSIHIWHYLAKSCAETIWNKWQVMCPQRLWDRKDPGTFPQLCSIDTLRSRNHQPSAALVCRQSFESQLPGVCCTKSVSLYHWWVRPLNPWPKVDSFHALVDPSKSSLRCKPNMRQQGPKQQPWIDLPRWWQPWLLAKAQLTVSQPKSFKMDLHKIQMQMDAVRVYAIPKGCKRSQIAWQLIKQNQSNSCWKNGPANTPKSCALRLKNGKQNGTLEASSTLF